MRLIRPFITLRFIQTGSSKVIWVYHLVKPFKGWKRRPLNNTSVMNIGRRSLHMYMCPEYKE